MKADWKRRWVYSKELIPWRFQNGRSAKGESDQATDFLYSQRSLRELMF